MLSVRQTALSPGTIFVCNKQAQRTVTLPSNRLTSTHHITGHSSNQHMTEGYKTDLEIDGVLQL